MKWLDLLIEKLFIEIIKPSSTKNLKIEIGTFIKIKINTHKL